MQDPLDDQLKQALDQMWEMRACLHKMMLSEDWDDQSQEYRDLVLPPDVRARVAIEQASTFGWERYVGFSGAVVAMSTFGASAPLKELQSKFGFTPERIVEAAHDQIRSFVNA